MRVVHQRSCQQAAALFAGGHVAIRAIGKVGNAELREQRVSACELRGVVFLVLPHTDAGEETGQRHVQAGGGGTVLLLQVAGDDAELGA